MKIQLASDLHIETRAPGEGLRLLAKTDADVLVLAGDIDYLQHEFAFINAVARRHHKPVLYVLGNHEFYHENWAQALQRCQYAAATVHVLHNQALVLGGVRFLGTTLWTDFALFNDPVLAMAMAQNCLADYRFMWVDGAPLRAEQTVRWHEQALAWLRTQLSTPFNGKTVIISHHAPHRNSIAARFAQDPVTAAFVSDLNHLFDGTAALWLHGHTHTCFDYSVNGTRVVCNVAGYPGEDAGRATLSAFQTDLVLEI